MEKPNKRESSENESRSGLPDDSRANINKNQQAKAYRRPLTEDEFYSIIQEELRKKDLKVTAEIVIAKDMPLEERRKEAEKPLYLLRYE